MGLEGEARAFAERTLPRLDEMASPDRDLWVEIAAFLSPQRIREKRQVFAAATDGLRAISDHPELRESAHAAATRFAGRSPRLVGAYLGMCRDLAGSVTTAEFEEVTLRALDLARDVDLASTFMDAAPGLLSRRSMDFLRAWHAGAVALWQTEWWAARGFLQSVAKAAHWLHEDDLPVLADLGKRVADRSRHAVKGLYGALPSLVASMPVPQLVEWVELGLRITEREEELVLFMSYGSKRSQEAVEFLCRETSFSAFRGKIALMLEAFLGRPALVKSMYDLLDPATIPPDVPAFSDGDTLYVRPSLACGGTSPFALYKLVALHAAAHDRFGSFEDRELADSLLHERGLLSTERRVDDLDRFLFSVCEDFRIDVALFHTLPGLRRDAELVLEETYGHIDQETSGEGARLTPAALRAHLAAFRFGVRVLGPAAGSAQVEVAVAPLAEQTAGAADSVAAADRLRRLVEPLWYGPSAIVQQEQLLDLTSVPHPPYHDYLLLGLTLASMGDGDGAGAGNGKPLPGVPLDVPGSMHPSEVVEGLEMTFHEKAEESDELLPFEDEEREEEEGVGECDFFSYHEWDHEVGDHRTRWCTVRERPQRAGDTGFVEATLERYQGEVLLIRRQFERLRPDRIRRFFHQREGDELDMDALVEAVIDAKAGAPITDSVFIRRDKKKREVAVLFLLDMSDSTDQLVDGERRIIDVEKEGLVLLGEAIGQLDDQYAMMGFSTHGRKLVDLFVIKDFAEPFDDRVAARIGGIEPMDYTRLGAAVRHGVARLAERDASSKLLVLLSDGRPYDLGYGDLQYAMEDTKNALSEGRRQGVNAFCITVDPKGHDYLEDLFGVNRYTVIQDVAHLPTKLPRIYRNLTT